MTFMVELCVLMAPNFQAQKQSMPDTVLTVDLPALRAAALKLDKLTKGQRAAWTCFMTKLMQPWLLDILRMVAGRLSPPSSTLTS